MDGQAEHRANSPHSDKSSDFQCLIIIIYRALPKQMKQAYLVCLIQLPYYTHENR